MRACGECTLCCKVMPFAVLDGELPVGTDLIGDVKAAGRWCSACTKFGDAAGCDAFFRPDRPNSCSSFECAWLQSQATENAMPAEMRPDRCQTVIVIERDFFVLKVNPASLAAKPWRKSPLREAVQAWDRAGIKVRVECGSYRALLGGTAIDEEP